ncbi:MAG: hypothetical protein ACOCXM_10255 [Myxococcota bacterium]
MRHPRPPLLGLVLVVVACVSAVPLDPTGDEYSIEGRWLLQAGDMGDPQDPTQAACDGLGVVEVQLRFFSEVGGQTFASDMFRFPCAQGSFDSRDPGFPADDPKVLASGTYFVQYQGLDAEGEIVGRSRRSELKLILEDPAHDAIATGDGADVIVVELDES